MSNLKFKFDFTAYGLDFQKEIEMTAEAVKENLEKKIWRSCVVLKNAYNAKLESRAKLSAYLKENAQSIDIERLMTEPEYKKGLQEKADKLELKEVPAEKTESDFIAKAIEKVMNGEGQND